MYQILCYHRGKKRYLQVCETNEERRYPMEQVVRSLPQAYRIIKEMNFLGDLSLCVSWTRTFPLESEYFYRAPQTVDNRKKQRGQR